MATLGPRSCPRRGTSSSTVRSNLLCTHIRLRPFPAQAYFAINRHYSHPTTLQEVLVETVGHGSIRSQLATTIQKRLLWDDATAKQFERGMVCSFAPSTDWKQQQVLLLPHDVLYSICTCTQADCYDDGLWAALHERTLKKFLTLVLLLDQV